MEITSQGAADIEMRIQYVLGVTEHSNVGNSPQNMCTVHTHAQDATNV